MQPVGAPSTGMEEGEAMPAAGSHIWMWMSAGVSRPGLLLSEAVWASQGRASCTCGL